MTAVLLIATLYIIFKASTTNELLCVGSGLRAHFTVAGLVYVAPWEIIFQTPKLTILGNLGSVYIDYAPFLIVTKLWEEVDSRRRKFTELRMAEIQSQANEPLMPVQRIVQPKRESRCCHSFAWFLLRVAELCPFLAFTCFVTVYMRMSASPYIFS